MIYSIKKIHQKSSTIKTANKICFQTVNKIQKKNYLDIFYNLAKGEKKK